MVGGKRIGFKPEEKEIKQQPANVQKEGQNPVGRRGGGSVLSEWSCKRREDKAGCLGQDGKVKRSVVEGECYRWEGVQVVHSDKTTEEC